MYEDLEPIANLKYGQVVESVTREERTDLQAKIAELAGRGLSNSGMMTSARLDWAGRTSERICRALYDIWLELILQRNQGRLSRKDIEFIMAKVGACADAQSRNIAHALTSAGTGPTTGPRPDWAAEQGRVRIHAVAGAINRELEIKLREQEAFRKEHTPLDTRFRSFLHAFGENWLTAMSGPLTVPFAVGALFAPGLYKLFFAVLALVSAVFSSYRVWRAERQRMNDLRGNKPT